MLSTGTGGMLCAHCGRPMAAGVLIGGQQYHEECTHGPGFQQVPPTHPYTLPIWTVPAGLTEERVRAIILEELVRLNMIAVRDRMD